jgi:hypothetical protein
MFRDNDSVIVLSNKLPQMDQKAFVNTLNKLPMLSYFSTVDLND